MRISLAPAHVRRLHAEPMADGPVRPLLAGSGPRVVLGGRSGADHLAQAIRPQNDTLFGPRGACLAGRDGPLFICDTGHHRLVVWRRVPTTDHEAADSLIGQPSFNAEGRNAKAEIGPSTLNVPTGVAADSGVLAVADAWNHRVLIWHGYPWRANQPADVVLGQADFAGGLANRGAKAPDASTLNWCYGVAIAERRLMVADTGNRRVLVWDGIPTENGAPADLVMGQSDFITRDENAGQGVGAVGMRWPHGIAVTNGMILVADAGNNRIMAWRRWPRANGERCDFVLGQADLRAGDHNQAEYYPTAAAMSMPYGIAVQDDRVVVADTANSRLLGFDLTELAMGARASRLVGQPDFTHKGDNRWGMPARDSLCWPYGVASCGETLVIADSGNNRVLLWDATS